MSPAITARSGLSASADRPPLTPTLRRLASTLLPANLSIFFVWGVYQVLLAAQVQDLAPDDKEAQYAIVATLGALLAMLAQPIAGILSDRTRSRFGRRAPWMVAGALVGGLALIGVGSAQTLVQLAVSWCIVQVALNVTQGPLSAVLPDRVPTARRGLFASLLGAGVLAGSLLGQVFASIVAPDYLLGWATAAGIVTLGIVGFVLLNPDRASEGDGREPWRWRALLSTFWVDPRRHPNFALAFGGRLGINIGYSLVTAYQLYLLQEHIGLDLEQALALVPLLALTGLATNLPVTLVSGPLSDRLGRRRVFVIVCGVVIAVALAMPAIFPTVGGMFAFAAIAGAGFGIFQSVDLALVTEVLPDATEAGKDLGVINIAATVPQTVAPLIASVIVLSGGGYAALFPWGIAIVLVGAGTAFFMRGVR